MTDTLITIAFFVIVALKSLPWCIGQIIECFRMIAEFKNECYHPPMLSEAELRELDNAAFVERHKR